jgi:hypothetical protein
MESCLLARPGGIEYAIYHVVGRRERPKDPSGQASYITLCFTFSNGGSPSDLDLTNGDNDNSGYTRIDSSRF